jgi:hypothetical protein
MNRLDLQASSRARPQTVLQIFTAGIQVMPTEGLASIKLVPALLATTRSLSSPCPGHRQSHSTRSHPIRGHHEDFQCFQNWSHPFCARCAAL